MQGVYTRISSHNRRSTSGHGDIDGARAMGKPRTIGAHAFKVTAITSSSQSFSQGRTLMQLGGIAVLQRPPYNRLLALAEPVKSTSPSFRIRERGLYLVRLGKSRKCFNNIFTFYRRPDKAAKNGQKSQPLPFGHMFF